MTTAAPLPRLIELANRITHYVVDGPDAQRQGLQIGERYRWATTTMECIAIFGDGSALLRVVA